MHTVTGSHLWPRGTLAPSRGEVKGTHMVSVGVRRKLEIHGKQGERELPDNLDVVCLS